ncbi:uncharacterized protein LOC119948761 [Tachyglossus aculeatus]|uniref:uncharacterized protein LOC119948761 n=1 Tax=Tachyglossus aculeatus TaxID=9261 RepID=UPI0018F67D1E|nr:uncharacterized protein LOC119948761 [Tachyglossus aculeatus]
MANRFRISTKKTLRLHYRNHRGWRRGLLGERRPGRRYGSDATRRHKTTTGDSEQANKELILRKGRSPAPRQRRRSSERRRGDPKAKSLREKQPGLVGESEDPGSDPGPAACLPDTIVIIIAFLPTDTTGVKKEAEFTFIVTSGKFGAVWTRVALLGGAEETKDKQLRFLVPTKGRGRRTVSVDCSTNAITTATITATPVSVLNNGPGEATEKGSSVSCPPFSLDLTRNRRERDGPHACRQPPLRLGRIRTLAV